MKRFGRNQKRKLRELVASLNEQIVGPFEPASGRHHALTDLITYIHSRDITDSQCRRYNSREADIVVAHSPKLIELYRQGGWNFETEYDGIVWSLRDIEMADLALDHSSGRSFGSDQFIGEAPRMRLKLHAIGRKTKRN